MGVVSYSIGNILHFLREKAMFLLLINNGSKGKTTYFNIL